MAYCLGSLNKRKKKNEIQIYRGDKKGRRHNIKAGSDSG